MVTEEIKDQTSKTAVERVLIGNCKGVTVEIDLKDILEVKKKG